MTSAEVNENMRWAIIVFSVISMGFSFAVYYLVVRKKKDTRGQPFEDLFSKVANR